MFGFLNRWNDTLATPLEDEPIAIGEKFLAPRGFESTVICRGVGHRIGELCGRAQGARADARPTRHRS
jgi:hypothetical protein